jgi:hypothetical protein
MFGTQMSFIWTFILCYLLKQTVINSDFKVERVWPFVVVIGLIEPLLLAIMYHIVLVIDP